MCNNLKIILKLQITNYSQNIAKKNSLYSATLGFQLIIVNLYIKRSAHKSQDHSKCMEIWQIHIYPVFIYFKPHRQNSVCFPYYMSKSDDVPSTELVLAIFCIFPIPWKSC